MYEVSSRKWQCTVFYYNYTQMFAQTLTGESTLTQAPVHISGLDTHIEKAIMCRIRESHFFFFFWETQQQRGRLPYGGRTEISLHREKNCAACATGTSRTASNSNTKQCQRVVNQCSDALPYGIHCSALDLWLALS